MKAQLTQNWWQRSSLGIVLLFVLGMVAACGSAPATTGGATTGEATTSNTAAAATSGEPVSLTMSVWGSKDDVAVYTKRLELAKQKYPEISVELNYIPSDYDQKVQTMIVGGTGPDILQLAEGVHAFSSKGQIIALDEYIKSANVDLTQRYGESVGQLYARNGSVYAMPDRGGAMIMYYNKDMFDKAGVSYPTADWTWEDFRNAALKLTVREGDTTTQWGFAAGDWWPWWMSFIYQNGGRVIDSEGKPVVNSPEAVEAMTFYNNLVHVDKVAPSPTDYANMGEGAGPDPLFAQGKVAMIMTGFWNIASLKNVENLNWDIAPVFKNKERGTVVFGSGLAVSKDSKHPAEAFKIIEFLTSEEGQMPIVEMGQDAPANLAVLNSDAFLKGSWANQPINMAVFKESAPAVFVPPLVPQWNEMLKVFGDNLSEVFQNNAEVAPTMDTIQTQLEDLFAR